MGSFFQIMEFNQEDPKTEDGRHFYCGVIYVDVEVLIFLHLFIFIYCSVGIEVSCDSEVRGT